MEFSFELYNWLDKIYQEPVYIVTACIFGIPLLMIAIALFAKPLTSRASSKVQYTVNILLYVPLIITWFAGFALSVPMLVQPFSEVDGIRIFLMICTIYLCVFMFCLLNMTLLSNWMRDGIETINQRIAAKRER
ncbi:hypothetical protein [Serratia microhaemolytica]|uniref:hypothetical protein n=1 Tax=Serratia microhaemolytica TaxID=2675110 RepID=UPI000FDE7048|nr:hypothetical protein [Serratia microhaemolytica]